MHEFLDLLELMQEEHEHWKSIPVSSPLPAIASTSDYLIASPPEASLALCWSSPRADETSRRDCDTDPERDDEDDDVQDELVFVTDKRNKNNKRSRQRSTTATEEEDMTRGDDDVDDDEGERLLPARRRKRSRRAGPADEDSPSEASTSCNPHPR
jgi:hypothetical protein